MFSLNVPIAPAVDRLAADLQSKPSGFDRVRDRRTLVCKRFGVEDVPDRVASDERGGGGADASPGSPTRGPSPPNHALDALRDDLRPLLAGTDPFPVAVTGIDVFDAPASGSGPVLYLTVESDALVRVHRRLCAAYGTVEGIEGDEYVPHVTVARGGDPESGVVADLVAAEFDPIRWRVHALDLYDPEFREVAASIDL
ncbi:phosphoesterase [Halorubrum saccharovorum]|uniref:Phosphoesterase n=1 Tax=Halorubrum saccharovorum TaxID=2248 RepID=A0A0F8D674_9EURY|nr:2'-5' RNA ligase family protein [Halorubrum saccharovorum]KKF39789.1 phosphoesterase [Halorubrum saccharovorum]